MALVAVVPRAPAVPVLAQLLVLLGPGAGARAAGPGGPGAGAGPGGPPGPGGAPRAGGFGGGPGRGFGGGGAAAAPAQPPVVLSRNGKEFTVTGETPVIAGTEIKVATERPNLPISVSQLDSGSWVIFELPGFTTAASGTEQNSPWMHYARPVPPRTTRARMNSGSRWSRPDLLPAAVVAALVEVVAVEAASRSAGKLNPVA